MSGGFPVDFAHLQQFEASVHRPLFREKMPDREMTSDLFFFARGETGTASAPRPASPAARLVERIREGEQEAFGELYQMFAPMVHGIILARVPRDEVADIVQDVFIAAYRNLHSLRESGAVGGWLAMIARNHAAEFFRRMKQTEELSENTQHDDSSKTR